MEKHKNKSVPIWEKSNLTLTEAAEYFNIGEHRLREITNNHKCNFVLFIGTKRLIKRKEFEKYLEQVNVICGIFTVVCLDKTSLIWYNIGTAFEARSVGKKVCYRLLKERRQ